MEKIVEYIRHARSEIAKVIFPTKEQMRNAFISVFVVVTVISLFLALIDVIMSYSLSSLI